MDIALTKALSYVSLSCDTKLDDDKAQKRKASLFQRYSTISGNQLTFFSLELADMSQETLDAQMENSPELCLLYTSPSPRDATLSRMPSSA